MSSTIRVHLVSLGCPKNLVDSEVFLGRIASEGFQITPEPRAADVLMVNTCGFIDDAKDESIQTILGLSEHQEDDPNKAIVVVGCMAQRYPEELAKEIPEIDAIIGLSEYSKMSEILRGVVAKRQGLARTLEHARINVGSKDYPTYSEGSRLRLTLPHTAYLRLSEGCDNPCTFCSIPSFRGKLRSKALTELVDEAKELVQSGATEINLISQDLTSYGSDIDGDYLLPSLLESLNKIDDLRWIRLLYAYPYRFTNDMIDAVRDTEKVLPYIDMPLQHINDRMLKRMGRRMGQLGTQKLFERMRERIPGLALRTTFIVGFPGETEEEFQQLVDFIEEFKIERVGAFTYSDEENTPAAKLPDKISEEIQQDRLDRLMLAQQKIAYDWNQQRLGTQELVLIDGVEQDANGDYIRYARSYAEAPEIDGKIYVPMELGNIGDYKRVEIKGVQDYDLIADVPSPDSGR